MAFLDEMKNEMEVLQNVSRIAESISQQLTQINIPKTQYPLPLNADSLIPELDLTVPADMMAPISSIEVPDSLRETILQRLHRFVGDLQQKYQSAYKHTCLETLRGTNSTQHIDAIHQTYLSLLQRQFLPMVRSQVAFVVQEVAKYQAPHPDSKRPFNSEFTPALEKYFELNAYPSVAHRTILAQKSGMIPRQIEVWFQNHRNRAKKEAKIIPRLDSYLPLQQALSVLQGNPVKCISRMPTPPMEKCTNRHFNAKDYSEQSLQTSSTPKLDNGKRATFLDDSYPLRPLHAYPSKKDSQFPDPFPNDDGSFKFPSPVWRRKPATSPISSSAVDMDNFAQMFHLKLNFSENTRRRGNSPTKEPLPDGPWFSCTTTTTSSAPHPSLVRSFIFSQTPCLQPLFSMETSISDPTFGVSSLPTSNVPRRRRLPSSQPSARKVRPLPRRLPPRSQSSFGSRTSSFTSNTSSGSRSSSSSSNYSLSPELSTPPLPPVDLPVAHDDITHQNIFDFSYSELETHISNLLPSQDLNLSNPYHPSDKFTDMSSFDNIFSHNLEEIHPYP